MVRVTSPLKKRKLSKNESQWIPAGGISQPEHPLTEVQQRLVASGAVTEAELTSREQHGLLAWLPPKSKAESATTGVSPDTISNLEHMAVASDENTDMRSSDQSNGLEYNLGEMSRHQKDELMESFFGEDPKEVQDNNSDLLELYLPPPPCMIREVSPDSASVVSLDTDRIVAHYSAKKRRTRRIFDRLELKRPNLSFKGFLELPDEILGSIMSYMDMKQSCRLMSVCKRVKAIMESPGAWDFLAVDVDEPKRPPIEWWQRMGRKNGAFCTLSTVRVFRKPDDWLQDKETESPGYIASNLKNIEAVFEVLACCVSGLNVLTVEFGGTSANLALSDESTFKDSIKTILEKSASSLRMILFHTDCDGGSPFPIPDCQFPRLMHLNFAGDFDPKRNFLDRSRNLTYLKLTSTPSHMEKATSIALDNHQNLSELTFRPWYRGDDIDGSVVSLHMLREYGRFQHCHTNIKTLEWNTSYCGVVGEEQLVELLRIPKHYIKVSSECLNDRTVGELLKNTQAKGIFIGMNNIEDKDEFVDKICKRPLLSWLRLTSLGPPLTNKDMMKIRKAHPQVNLWIREAREEDETELVHLWEAAK